MRRPFKLIDVCFLVVNLASAFSLVRINLGGTVVLRQTVWLEWTRRA
jgi:hypothetical protein